MIESSSCTDSCSSQCGHGYRFTAYLSSGRGNLSLFYTPKSRLVNIKIGKHVGHYFLMSNLPYHIDQNPASLVCSGHVCYIEARGMREIVGRSQSQGQWHLGQWSIDRRRLEKTTKKLLLVSQCWRRYTSWEGCGRRPRSSTCRSCRLARPNLVWTIPLH